MTGLYNPDLSGNVQKVMDLVVIWINCMLDAVTGLCGVGKLIA